jgi:hypothetical protein
MPGLKTSGPALPLRDELRPQLTRRVPSGSSVVVPIEEYQQLRQAMQEQQGDEEFDAARARYLARREAGAIRYVSHEEAARRLGMPSR